MRPNVETLRSKQADYMTEVGRVEHPTGGYVYDPVTQTEVEAVDVTYSGPMLVRPRVDVKTEEVGGRTVVVGQYDVTLPVDSEVVTGDTVVVESAPYDAALVGERFRVLDVPVDAWQVARYCLAERFT